MDDLQLGDCGRAQAVDLRQPCRWRRYYFRERTERRDQSLCERFDVTPRNCAKQHELEEFVVVDGFCTGFTKTGAQPLAMAMIVMPDMWDRVFRHKTKLA
jgi:hypothetical protein